ncbi:hypothetical protein, partial [Acetobacter malorum]
KTRNGSSIMRRYQFPYVPVPRGRPPLRWTDTQEPMSCRRCNTHWEEGDPVLTIACTGCHAPAHEPCRRGSGGNEQVCACRDEAAVQLGLLSRCEGLSWDSRHVKPLTLRATPVATALMCRSVRTGAPVSRWAT